MPAVTKLLERAQPSLDAAAARYMVAHDSIVASEAYSNAMQSAQGVLSSVQGTHAFAAIFPVISPTWEAIAHSPYYEVRPTIHRRVPLCFGAVNSHNDSLHSPPGSFLQQRRVFC